MLIVALMTTAAIYIDERLEGYEGSDLTNVGEYSTDMHPNMYRTADNSGYNDTYSNRIYNIDYGRLSTLSIQSDSELQTTYYGGIFTIVNPSNLSLTLEFPNDIGINKSINGSKYKLSDDSFSEDVNNVSNTGKVGSGVFIVKTSQNGYNWSDPTRGLYEDGLFSSNALNTSALKQYVPSGEQIVQGVYVKIIFAYEIYETKHILFIPYNNYYNMVETYTLYILNDDPDLISFHNLSLYQDENYDPTETMESGASTSSGFVIDRRLCPTASVSVSRDSHLVPGDFSQNLWIIDEPGSYTINISTRLGSTKTVKLWVGLDEAGDVLDVYFGHNLISGHRIYADGPLPVYLQGSSISIKDVGDAPPIQGVVCNSTNGMEFIIDASDGKEHAFVLDDPGIYSADFKTSEEISSGDIWHISFSFKIVSYEDAPEPWMNKHMLESSVDIRDYDGVTYSVVIPTQGSGSINVLFSSYESAYRYAWDYVNSQVEKVNSDSGVVFQAYNTTFVDILSLSEFVDSMAKSIVYESDLYGLHSSPLLTISDDNLTDLNLLNLNLNHNLFIVNDPEEFPQEDFSLIFTKRYVDYYNPLSGKIDRIEYDFEFKQYDGGVDSSSVSVLVEGVWVPLQYNVGVVSQFESMGIGSGLLKIRETTAYGKSIEYDVMYQQTFII